MASVPPVPPRQLRGDSSPVVPSTRDVPPHEKDRDSDRTRADRMGRGDAGRLDRDRERIERQPRPERDREEKGRLEKPDRTSNDDREWKPNREAGAAETTQRQTQNTGFQSPSVSSLADRISAAPGGRSVDNRFEGNSARDEPSERLKRSNSDRDKVSEPPLSSGVQPLKNPNKKPKFDRNRLNSVVRNQVGSNDRRR